MLGGRVAPCSSGRRLAPDASAGVETTTLYKYFCYNNFSLSCWSRYGLRPTLPTDYLLQSLYLFHQFIRAGHTVIDITRFSTCIQQKRGRDAEHAPYLREIRSFVRVDLDHLHFLAKQIYYLINSWPLNGLAWRTIWCSEINQHRFLRQSFEQREHIILCAYQQTLIDQPVRCCTYYDNTNCKKQTQQDFRTHALAPAFGFMPGNVPAGGCLVKPGNWNRLSQ